MSRLALIIQLASLAAGCAASAANFMTKLMKLAIEPEPQPARRLGRVLASPHCYYATASHLFAPTSLPSSSSAIIYIERLQRMKRISNIYARFRLMRAEGPRRRRPVSYNSSRFSLSVCVFVCVSACVYESCLLTDRTRNKRSGDEK